MRSVQQTQSDQPEVQWQYIQQVMFELQVVPHYTNGPDILLMSGSLESADNACRMVSDFVCLY